VWKQVYQPGENGLLNQALTMVGMAARDWLGDVNTAMVATIIPTVWAGMGISSLIYLAALKGIPQDLYEAADLDGAGIWGKLTKITIPQLAPLIIINFVGAFIGTFQSMGNIFLLTFGGPGKETMVLGMAIWLEAYNNLRFSVATSMAWVMGSALIGFAYLQIRILRKVEFRRVEEV
jgi:multiple sugar transport system permease protein